MITFSTLILNILLSNLAFSSECIHPPHHYNLFEGCYERRTIKTIGPNSVSIFNLIDKEREWGTSEEKENSVAIVLKNGTEEKLLATYCSGRCFDPGNPKPKVELNSIEGTLYLLSTYDVSHSDRHGVKLKLFVVDINSKSVKPISGDFEVRREEKVAINQKKNCYSARFNTLSYKKESSSHPSGYSINEKPESIPIRCVKARKRRTSGTSVSPKSLRHGRFGLGHLPVLTSIVLAMWGQFNYKYFLF